jgi:hypothetical protein
VGRYVGIKIFVIFFYEINQLLMRLIRFWSGHHFVFQATDTIRVLSCLRFSKTGLGDFRSLFVAKKTALGERSGLFSGAT